MALSLFGANYARLDELSLHERRCSARSGDHQGPREILLVRLRKGVSLSLSPGLIVVYLSRPGDVRFFPPDESSGELAPPLTQCEHF